MGRQSSQIFYVIFSVIAATLTTAAEAQSGAAQNCFSTEPTSDGTACAEREKVAVAYSLEKEGFVTLVIETPSGRRVRNLVSSKHRSTGRQVEMWDGRDDAGMFGQGDIHSGLQTADVWDNTHGCAAGTRGVFRTHDGGTSWQRILPAIEAPAMWSRVRMRGPEELWVSKRYHGKARAELFVTLDGGKPWDEVLQGRLQGASDLLVVGPVLYMLCGDFPSFRSIDNGLTWARKHFGGLLHGGVVTAWYHPVVAGKVRTIFVLGHYQRALRLVRSDDRGRSWYVVPVPVESGDSYVRASMYFTSSDVGAIRLTNGRVFFTRHGGESWIISQTPSSKGVTSLSMESSARGFAALEDDLTAAVGLALAEAEFNNGEYGPAYAGRVQFGEIAGSPTRLWAVGKVIGLPNDGILQIERR